MYIREICVLTPVFFDPGFFNDCFLNSFYKQDEYIIFEMKNGQQRYNVS